ncbi:MAG: crossover junction endodeoxyribonuclease RuvC [Oscillospiraceae bacterium]
MKIIGIDPGYAIVGYGVVDYKNTRFTTLDYGAITTQAKTDFSIRLQQIYDQFSNLLIIHKPDAASIEKLFFTNNQKTGIDVAQARGVIMLACQQHNVPCFEYTPLQVKQSVVGYGRAIKSQVMEMTKRILNLKQVPKPDDTADALALAICHAHVAPSIIMTEKINKIMQRG